MAKAKTKQTYEHREHEIQLTDGMRFRVVEFDREYDSYAAAQAAIDRKTESAARAKRKAIEVSAINEKGAEYKITGLHAGSGNFLTTPKSSHWDDLYLDSPLTREAVKELAAARRRVDAIDAILDRFKMRLADNRYDVSRYGEAVDEIANKATEMLAKAGKTTFAAELAKELKD